MDSHSRFVLQYVMGCGGRVLRDDLQQALSQHHRRMRGQHQQNGGGEMDMDNREGDVSDSRPLDVCLSAINEHLSAMHMRLAITPDGGPAGRPVYVAMVNEVGMEDGEEAEEAEADASSRGGQKTDMLMARRATRYDPLQIKYLALILERLVEQANDGTVSYSMLDAINERTKQSTGSSARRSGGDDDDDDEEEGGNAMVAGAQDAISKMSVTDCQRAINRFLSDGWLEHDKDVGGTGTLWLGVRTLTDLRDFLQERLEVDVMSLDQMRMQEKQRQRRR